MFLKLKNGQRLTLWIECCSKQSPSEGLKFVNGKNDKPARHTHKQRRGTVGTQERAMWGKTRHKEDCNVKGNQAMI